tara:strand:- start:371 stop:763 length:393 start_codon:yes stop_codon:yes gene_type:complete
MIKINFLQIISLFKSYWREILIIVLAGVVIGKMRVDYNKLESTYETTQEELEAQISKLNEIHAEEISKKNEALKTYKVAMENLEDDFQKQKKKNREINKKREIKLEETFSHDKEKFANEISNTFGFKYVP